MLLFITNTECFASCYEDFKTPFESFDGNIYDYKLLVNCANWEHFVILRYGDSNAKDYVVYCFNESLDIVNKEDGSIILTGDGGVTGGCYNFVDSSNSWGAKDNCPIANFTNEYSIIHCCDCMMQYKDNFTNDHFFMRPLQAGPGVLPPIIQVTPLKGVMKEIIQILPLILVVLVSFLGLRKALKMLSALLHRS